MTNDSDRRARLGLRRHFIEEHHAGQPLRVLDVAQEDGDLWETLRKEFTVDTYWQIPATPKKGFPKIDPAAVLSQEGWQENVIDLHMRRSPWPAWTALVPRIHQPTTVFLTIGRYRDADALVLDVLGAGGLHAPLGLVKKLQPMAVPYFLHLALEAGLVIESAGEVAQSGSTRAIGLHLRPAESSIASSDEPQTPKQRSLSAHE